MPSASLPETPATWERTNWRGEPAWASACAGVRAIVSEARSRLIYLGTEDGTLNLINAPWPQVFPSKDNPWPNQGGHRFWLGPQHRWVWPPPAEWEYAGAHLAFVRGATLVLEHARTNSAYPALTREYAWAGPRLSCKVRWKDDGQRYFGLHVVAVDTPFAISVQLRTSPEAPSGFVAARMIDPEPPVRLPHPVVSVEGSQATVRAGVQRVKLGFTSQPLEIARPGGWRLAVIPGPSGAVAPGELPDHGYLSQVWVGEAGCDLAELEQLTPHLQGDASCSCSSTIFIEATPPRR